MWSFGSRRRTQHPTQRGDFRHIVRGVVLRLFGALLAEQNDEWLVAGHRYMSETSLRKLLVQGVDDDAPAQLEVKTA